METRFPCHVEVNDDKPEAFDTNNALAIMYRICDVPTERVSISFELAPNQKVSIECKFNEGTADTNELSSDQANSSVKNFYFFQTEPLENAMAVMAKMKLFEWLTTLGDTRINTIIQKNLTSLSETAVKATYKELLSQPWLKFGAINTVSQTHAIVRQTLMSKGVEGANINSLNAVKAIQDEIQTRLSQPKPSPMQARPAAGGG